MSVGEIILRIVFGFLIPFVLINGIILFLFIQVPKIYIVDADSKDYEENKIKFTIDSFLPITDIHTSFQNTEVPYSKLGNQYVIDATNNGTYQIKVTSLNKATVNSYVEIETVDKEPPIIDLDNTIITGNTLTFSVTDNNSEINYDNIYATDEDGNKLTPSYVDKSSGTIQFKFDTNKKLTVHIEDNNGNYSETTFST